MCSFTTDMNGTLVGTAIKIGKMLGAYNLIWFKEIAELPGGKRRG